MGKKTISQFTKEDYKYYTTLDKRYYEIYNYSECAENMLSYGYFMNDNELSYYIDDIYFELKDNKEKYDLEDLYNSEIKEDEKGRYRVFDTDMLPNGAEVEIREYLEENSFEITLEEFAERKLIRSVKHIPTKMKLIEPKIYKDVRAFYLTVVS